MATTVNDLVLRFSAETEKLQRDLKKIERTTEKSGKRAAKSTNRIKRSLDGVSKSAKKAGLALAAAFGGRAVLQGLQSTFAAMNDLQTAAEGLGVSTDLIQELRFAFVAAGADASRVEKTLTDFIKRIGEARSNLGTLLPFLDEFGISLDHVSGRAKTSGELFDEIADLLSKLTDNTARAAIGNAAFGRAWVDVVAVLGDGSDALREVRREAHATGAVIDAQLVESAARADVQFNKLKLTLSQIFKRGVIRTGEGLGLIDKTQLTITSQLIEQQLAKQSKILENRKALIKEHGQEEYNRQLNMTNQALITLNETFTELRDPVSDTADGVETVENELAELQDRARQMRGWLKDLFPKENREEITDFLQEWDIALVELNKDTSEMSDIAQDSVYLIADSLEAMIFDLKNADDHVKNLIASFGRLIIQEATLAAARKVVSFAGFGFAGGGVMTGGGPAPLRSYSSGGVARHRQVAEFGEGSRPEAYVPLPDGRTIPVTVKSPGGGMGGGNATTVYQENHFGGGIERDVMALIMQAAPMLIEASKRGVVAESEGIRS